MNKFFYIGVNLSTMAKLIVKRANQFSDEEINQIIGGVVKMADSSSQIVYVYPFIKKPSLTSMKPMLRPGRVVNSGGAIQQSEPDVIAVEGDLIEKMQRWAVRVEGLSAPEVRNFRSKERAIALAHSLVKKGKGSTVKIFD